MGKNKIVKAENGTRRQTQEVQTRYRYEGNQQESLETTRKKKRPSGGKKILKRTAVALGASGGFAGIVSLMSGEAAAKTIVALIDLI